MRGLSKGQLQKIQICTITISSISVVSGLLFLYFYFMIHPSRRNFRHQLIFLLIFFDFIKAIAILVFSTYYYTHTDVRGSITTGLGWLTVFGIEGADAVIVAFAVHMALLIFNTQLNQLFSNLCLRLHIHLDVWDTFGVFKNRLFKNTRNNKMSEGGLYNVRYTVIFLSFLFPILVASISFYVPNTYQGYVYISFFRVWTGPWYFSWTIRHVIDVTIIIIYVAIYVYVVIQFKKVSKSFGNKGSNEPDALQQSDGTTTGKNNTIEHRGSVYPIFGGSVWYTLFQLFSIFSASEEKFNSKSSQPSTSISRGSSVADNNRLKDGKTAGINNKIENGNAKENNETNNENPSGNDNLNYHYAGIENDEISKQIQLLLYEDAMERFNSRKNQIMKQMKVIFIYPISYILLWLLPLINHYQIIRLGHETMWSTFAGGFCQSLNCFVDTVVFLFREKPWQLTTELDDLNGVPISTRNSNSTDDSFEFEKEMLKYNSHFSISNWRYYISWLPGYGSYSGRTMSPNELDVELNSYQFTPGNTVYGHGCARGNNNNNNNENSNNSGANGDLNISYGYDHSDRDYEDDDDDDECEYNKYLNCNNNTHIRDGTLTSDEFGDLSLKDFLHSTNSIQLKSNVISASPSLSLPSPTRRLSFKSKLKSMSIRSLDNAPAASSSTASSRSSMNGCINNMSNKSWHEKSVGSASNKSLLFNKSTTYNNKEVDQNLSIVSGGASSSNGNTKYKLKDSENINWNLQMFENKSEHSKCYNDNSSSNNEATDEILRKYKKRNSNEMDIREFLRLGPNY